MQCIKRYHEQPSTVNGDDRHGNKSLYGSLLRHVHVHVVGHMMSHVHRYPGLFSGGLVSREGPSQKQMEAATTRFTFFASGYSSAPAAGAAAGKPDKQVSQSMLLLMSPFRQGPGGRGWVGGRENVIRRHSPHTSVALPTGIYAGCVWDAIPLHTGVMTSGYGAVKPPGFLVSCGQAVTCYCVRKHTRNRTSGRGGSWQARSAGQSKHPPCHEPLQQGLYVTSDSVASGFAHGVYDSWI